MTTICGGRRLLSALLCLVALAVGTPTASAGTFTDSAAGCDTQTFSRPFLRWLDLAQYTLAPGGSLEGGAGGWTLSGGARVVAENESYRVGGASDGRSLSLPPGSSAVTSPMCVGIEHPTVRLFVSNSGSLLSTLKVEVLYEGLFGQVQALPIGLLVAGSKWQPTLPLPILANITGSLLSSDGETAVAFRFTPVGWFGGWRIDDVYVDPFKAH